MDWLRIIAAFYISVYIFYALKNVYRESILKTSIKAFFLLLSYFICIGVVIAFGSLFDLPSWRSKKAGLNNVPGTHSHALTFPDTKRNIWSA